MPKMKSHRASAKRFSATASGRIKRRRSHHSHILTKKSPKRKNHLASGTFASEPDAKNIKKRLPYL